MAVAYSPPVRRTSASWRFRSPTSACQTADGVTVGGGAPIGAEAGGGISIRAPAPPPPPVTGPLRTVTAGAIGAMDSDAGSASPSRLASRFQRTTS